MGKHDMKNEVKFSWEPMPDDFYRARITTLEKENLALREKIGELEKKNENAERGYEFVVKSNAHIKEQHQEEIRDMEDTIHELEYQIEKLKEAVVLAALREV
jgi:archaellum component FlaC